MPLSPAPADYTNTFRSLSSISSAAGSDAGGLDDASGLPAALATVLGPLEEVSRGCRCFATCTAPRRCWEVHGGCVRPHECGCGDVLLCRHQAAVQGRQCGLQAAVLTRTSNGFDVRVAASLQPPPRYPPPPGS